MEVLEAVARAEKAARSGDGWEAVRHLFEPEIIGRIRARLRRSWAWITDEQIDDATVDAYLALYEEISAGALVRRPVAWLATVAWRRAADSMRRTAPEQAIAPDALALPSRDPEEHQRTEAAFEQFRRLVERLVPEGLKSVMRVVVEAYRSGACTLTNREIAEVIGEHPQNVKKWRQRGFERLGRLAREEGLVTADFRLRELTADPTDEESED